MGSVLGPFDQPESPYTPEGATTLPLPSNDGFNTPLIQLSNPFPNGLAAPVGTANGDGTGLGIDLSSFGKVLSQWNFPRLVQMGGRLYF